MYENALNLDPRHYNAWHGPQLESQAGCGQQDRPRWGLGNIYHRQEEHESRGQFSDSRLLLLSIPEPIKPEECQVPLLQGKPCMQKLYRCLRIASRLCRPFK